MGSTFDALLAAGGAINPHPFYRECRSVAPIFWSKATKAWVLTRYSDVRRVLGEEDQFAVLYGQAGATIHGRTVLQMRGEEHRKKNAIIARVVRNPMAITGRIRQKVEAVSKQLIAELPTTPDVVDVRTEYTSLLPLTIIAWLLGIEDPTPLRGWYRALAQAGVENLVADPARQSAGENALHKFEAIIAPIIADKRRYPTDDLISALVTADYDGAPMSASEVETLCGFLLTAGVETTDRSLSSLFALLAEDETLWLRLQNDRSLVAPAAVEILRYEPPVQGLGRVALADTEFHGVEVPKGGRVIGIIASANRDDNIFDHPDDFDEARFAESADREFTPAGKTLPFGAGVHHCTGSLLAKLELTTAIGDFLDRFLSVGVPRGSSIDMDGVMLRSPATVPLSLTPRTPAEALGAAP
jgi:cytochrome P450